MASGVDTEGIIKKLVEVEARPIRQWETDNKQSSMKKQALGALKDRLAKLNNATKDLYGFRASFFDKKVTSSDPHIIEATAGKNAENGSRKVRVKQMAGYHKISSDPVDRNNTLKAGKFSINVNGEEKSIRFRGGNIKRFHEEFAANTSDIVNTSLINTAGDLFAFTVESKVPGEKGEIRISGDRDLLKSVGLVSGAKDEQKAAVSLVFDRKYFTSYLGKDAPAPQNGTLEVSADGKSVKVRGALWQEYVLPLEVAVKENSTLVFNIAHTEPPKEEEDALPYRIEVGPEEKTVIKGIELHSYNVSRVRPVEQKEKKVQPESIQGIGVVAMKDSGRIEKLYPIDRKAKGRYEIPVGRDFKDRKIIRVVFYCNEGATEYSEAKIVTPEQGKDLLEPKNVIAKSQNAQLVVEGIDITRDKNEGLTDVIKGLTLNLRGQSMADVTLTVESNSQTAIDKIKKFVDEYNGYIDFTSELTMADRTGKSPSKTNSTPKSGLFVGDMTILRLENSVKSTVASAYPSKAEEPVRVITQMGISTGAVNTAWETIKAGKLVVDEGKLNEVVLANPEGVRDFFGSDTDGDAIIDNGMAYQLTNVLKPFIMAGKNILQAKIDFESYAIENNNERIERQNEHLKRYEDKLRRKFAAMEKSISGTKSQGDWLNNQMKGMQGQGK